MSLNNGTQSLNTTPSVSTIIVVLNLVQQRFVNQLPLIITILGVIGFIGNTFTFLQPALRSNSFCIYTLCGSLVDVINLFVNLFPNYLNPSTGNLISTNSISLICKLKVFTLVFLPQLSMDLLIISLFDRYACTYGPTSRMRQFLQLKMIPWIVGITVIISCLLSLNSAILHDIVSGFGCRATNPTLLAILYISTHGIITPVVMLVIVFLTYRRFKLSRQRVGAVVVANANRLRNHFISMVFAQTFVSSFFILQWIIMYWYYLETQYDNKSAEGWAITYFVLSLTNNLYYVINVRSFYLSTLTSRLFRDTLIIAFLKRLPGHLYQRWNVRNRDLAVIAGARANRKTRPPHGN